MRNSALMLTEQEYKDLIAYGHVVIGGMYTPGKVYTLRSHTQNDIKAKCTQWFSAAGVRSDFKLIEE